MCVRVKEVCWYKNSVVFCSHIYQPGARVLKHVRQRRKGGAGNFLPLAHAE